MSRRERNEIIPTIHFVPAGDCGQVIHALCICCLSPGRGCVQSKKKRKVKKFGGGGGGGGRGGELVC